MTFLGYLFTGGWCFILVAATYTLIRTRWVFRNRMWLLDNDLQKYHRLPSYEYMLYRRPFCWDINKFIDGE